MPSDLQTAVLRRKAFALAGGLAGKGKPAYALLHDISGMESISGQTPAFWSGLVDHLQELHRRKEREGPGCTGKQWRYIQDLRAKLGMDATHWRNFLKKQLHLDHERFLTVAKARGAIAALTRMEKAAEFRARASGGRQAPVSEVRPQTETAG